MSNRRNWVGPENWEVAEYFFLQPSALGETEENALGCNLINAAWKRGKADSIIAGL